MYLRCADTKVLSNSICVKYFFRKKPIVNFFYDKLSNYFTLFHFLPSICPQRDMESMALT